MLFASAKIFYPSRRFISDRLTFSCAQPTLNGWASSSSAGQRRGRRSVERPEAFKASANSTRRAKERSNGVTRLDGAEGGETFALNDRRRDCLARVFSHALVQSGERDAVSMETDDVFIENRRRDRRADTINSEKHEPIYIYIYISCDKIPTEDFHVARSIVKALS